MKRFIVYGTAVLALSSAPVLAQVGSGTSGQGRVTPVPNSTSQPPATGGATDQGGSRPGTATPDGSTPAQPNAPTGSGAPGGRDGAAAKNDEKDSPRVADESFVIDAARGGMAEVELAHLAEQKAANERVKQFAQKMIADHGKANTELRAIADSKDINVPMDLGESHKEMMDRLSKLSGPAFDQAYIQAMVADHTKSVVEFRKEAENGKDAAVKAFAAKTLPTIEEHMKMVQEIYQSLGRGAVGTSGTAPTSQSPASPNPR
jgi:putative membrane protein